MKLNNILSGKVEVVGKPTTFLLKWNEEQQKKVYNALMKVFKNILSIYSVEMFEL